MDIDEPWRVIARSTVPIMRPEAPYETSGFLPNVIFCNGMVERGNGEADLYYGAADETVCGATIDLSAVLESLTG